MAAKRSNRSYTAAGAVTSERAARLCRLVELLGKGPLSRDDVMRRLRIDIRSFYRDLEVLRGCGITLPLQGGRYHLKRPLADALGRLPFPDPLLNLAEATQLAKGTTPAHQKLRKLIGKIQPARKRGS